MNAPIKGQHIITSIMNAILYPVLPFTKIIANATENHRQLITLLLTAADHPQMITLVIIKEVILPIQVIQDKTVSQNFQGVNHSKDILKCKIELLTLPHP